ncbi:hypothetical protein Tco_0127105 [Tanacetum coccineum]
MKMVNIFVDMDTELVEGSEVRAKGSETRVEGRSKRAGEGMEQESFKKQKLEKDKETTELQRLIEVVPDKEEVAIDVIPLATKPPSIIDYKIHKEGKKTYYQIIRADGSLKIFLSSSKNNSRINGNVWSIPPGNYEASMKKLEILKKNIKFRERLLGLKDFMMILELLLLRFVLLLLSKT